MPTLRSKPSDRSPNGKVSSRKKAKDASEARKHFVAATGEFVGTFLFLFFAFLGHSMAVTQSGESGPGGLPSSQQVVFVSLSYGFSLLVTAWTLFRVSGGLFNPAVTLGMVVSGSLPPIRGLVLFPAQMLGAMCAAAVASAIIPGDISIVSTTLAPDMSIVRGVFLEMFLTSQLVFTILMLAAEKSKDTFIAPIGIGLALFIVEIAGVFYTGASVNPARSFGPCVAAASFPGYHWIYWVGPCLGGLLAAGYYRFLKWMNEGDIGEANPGQDSAAGAFDAEVEEVQSGQAEEGRATPIHSSHAQQPSWGSGGQPAQTYSGAGQQKQQGWGPNTISEMNRRSGDAQRRPV